MANRPRHRPELNKDKVEPLRERMLIFCQAFVDSGGNRADAASAAGYNGNRKCLHKTASRLLKDDRIKKEIERLKIIKSQGLKVVSDKGVSPKQRSDTTLLDNIRETKRSLEKDELENVLSEFVTNNVVRVLETSKGPLVHFDVSDANRIKAAKLLAELQGFMVQKIEQMNRNMTLNITPIHQAKCPECGKEFNCEVN